MSWLTHLSTVGSSNDFALEGLLGGRLSHGCVVLADAQTAGRGRQGKPWRTFSGDAGIAMTLLLTNHLTEHAPLLVSLAVFDVIAAGADEGLTIKWPNDLLMQGHKICGILVEAGKVQGQAYQLVGCGINLCGRDQDGWESIESLSGVKLKRMDMVKAIRERVLTLLEEGWLTHKARYEKHVETIGKAVTWRQVGKEDIHGIATELTESGALNLHCDDGSTYTIQSGEIIRQGTRQ